MGHVRRRLKGPEDNADEGVQERPPLSRGRRLTAGLGHALIRVGVLILLFVAYQLWGTGFAEASSQRRLKQDLKTVLAPTTTTAPGSTTPTTAFVAPPATPDGDAIAIIKIPKIGVEKAVVEGVGVSDLKKGPGHYKNTPMPGQAGNAAIAGHRTTYGAPFFRLDEMKAGDPIFITTRQGKFRYEVIGTQVVSPRSSEVLNASPDNRLTLTTCNPRFSAAQRLILTAALKGPAVETPPTPVTSPASPSKGLAQEEKAGLSGRTTATRPAIAWGLLAALIWLVTYLAGRRGKQRFPHHRRWPAYVIGVGPFAAALFIFFENFARLLPANF
jgi:sortase A